MRTVLTLLVAIATFGITHTVSAQLPPAPPELAIYKKDVGEWDCEIKVWDEKGEATVSKGSETDRMMGDFWLISNFKGNMMGMDFEGHGTYGYDPEKKQYIGTWMDSLGPAPMHVVGTYDKEKETMTFVGEALGPDMKNMAEHTLTTTYKDGKRVMTMDVKPKDGEKFRMMQITYSRKKAKAEK